MKQTIDSRRLKAFVVLAENGSYTATARQLFLTHSAISHAMRALETEVGCRLLRTLNKKAILTEAGEALLPHAQRVLAEMQQAHTTLSGLNKWGVRRLRLAVSPDFDADFLAPVLVTFHREFPSLRLRVETGVTGEPEDWLLENRADIVLAEQPPAHEEIEFISLLTGSFQLVVNADHPLAKAKTLPRKELGAHPCFLPRTTVRARKQMEEYLVHREFNLTLAGEIDSPEAIKQFIQHTKAISFLPAWSVAPQLQSGVFTTLPLGRTSLEKSWGILHPRHRPLNHAESTLVKLCRKRFAERQEK